MNQQNFKNDELNADLAGVRTNYTGARIVGLIVLFLTFATAIGGGTGWYLARRRNGERPGVAQTLSTASQSATHATAHWRESLRERFQKLANFVLWRNIPQDERLKVAQKIMTPASVQVPTTNADAIQTQANGQSTKEAAHIVSHEPYDALGVVTATDQVIGETPTTAQLPASPFTLELAVVGTRQEAEKKVDELAKHGVDAFYTPLNKEGRLVFRVRRGVFDNEAAARVAQEKLETHSHVKTAVVRL